MVRAMVAVVVVVGLMLVSACSGGMRWPVDEESTLKPLAFGQQLWNTRNIGLDDVDGVTIHDTSVIVAGQRQFRSTLIVLDARTGRVIWTLAEADPLAGSGGAYAWGDDGFSPSSGGPVVVGDDGDWMMIIPYQHRKSEYSDGPSEGIAAMSGKDGRFRWKTPLSSSEEHVRVAAADQKTILVGTGSGDSVRTIAFGTADGRKLWEQPGVLPQSITAGTVLGVIPDDVAELTGTPWKYSTEQPEGTVVGLDLATGANLWSLKDRLKKSVIEAATSGMVAVRGRPVKSTDEYSYATLALDARTGHAIGSFGKFAPCAADGGQMIACNDVGALMTLRAGEDAFRRSDEGDVLPENSFTWDLEGAWRGYIFGSTKDRDDVVRTFAVDRSGNRLGDTPQGKLAAGSDHYTVFCVGAGATSCGVYGMGSPAAADPQPTTAAPGKPAPITFDAEPLWEGRSDNSYWGPAIEVVDDALLQSGRDQERTVRVLVSDVETGKKRWSVSDGQRLAADGTHASFDLVVDVSVLGEGSANGWSVLLAYEKGEEKGVAALSGESGKLLWKIPVTKAKRNWLTPSITADDELILVSAFSQKGRKVTQRTFAYSTNTRRKLWEASGFTVVIAGGTGLAWTGSKPEGPTTAVGLDAKTGQKRWDLAGRFKTSQPRYARDDLAVVSADDAIIAIDPATGRERAVLNKKPRMCTGDGESLIACTVGEEGRTRLATIQLTDGVVRVNSPLLPESIEVDHVWKGRIFARTVGTDVQYVVLDASGASLGQIPGKVQDINDHYVVFARDDDNFTVHRLR
ncbi:PQQ-binding-like beta-propeller repeat protein [Nonomuraea sp. NPDC005983]|uniref:outer membrane protein assembly factor BamB family protein n=1 Tax=Nonomuraea sp. NPDC005983 TaxID=3155595 RepID=UPI0033AA3A10